MNRREYELGQVQRLTSILTQQILCVSIGLVKPGQKRNVNSIISKRTNIGPLSNPEIKFSKL